MSEQRTDVGDSAREAGAESAARGDAATQAACFFQHGIEAAGQGRADDAIDGFRQALRLRPDFTAAHANLGLLLVATGRHAEAEVHLSTAVTVMPSDAVLRNALGIAQESASRLHDAELSYRAALALRPGFAEAHANLGNSLRRQGRLDEAETHYGRAIELQPDFAVAHYNLGIVLQERERNDEAIAQYRLALSYRADHVDALINLSNCLRQQGTIGEARATLERVLELRPDNVEALCNLAQLKTYAPGDPQIERLLSQQHRLPSLHGHGRIRYWFALGKMFEDVGRYDESFAAYSRGNGLKHAQTPWDEASHLDTQRRIVATFTPAVIGRAAADASAEGPVPVFIVGMPRSGTSLLEQVLSTLPGIHGAGEITCLAETLESALAAHEADGFQFPELFGDYSTNQFLQLGRGYIERIRALAPQASHIVDKLPANFTHIGLIHLMFPNARIVHAMRDPMDSCFSCFSRLFSGENLGFTYDIGALGRYWASYRDLMRHWREVLPDGRLLEVSYETMVADFENQARRLVDYLGLPWDARCLEFHDSKRQVKTASNAQVRRPIYRTSVARWRHFESHLAQLRAIVEG